MKIKELIEIISQKTGKNISQSLLATALGVTRQNVCTRAKTLSELTIKEVEKVEQFFKISILEREKNSLAKVDFYPDVFASCGNGTFALSEEKELIDIPIALFSKYSPHKQYSMIFAKGDSMSPFINNGDKLLVEHISENEIVDNKIYVFCYKSEVFVKRLSKNLDELMIVSDNPNYNTRVIKGDELNTINIIGQIVGVIRNI